MKQFWKQIFESEVRRKGGGGGVMNFGIRKLERGLGVKKTPEKSKILYVTTSL